MGRLERQDSRGQLSAVTCDYSDKRPSRVLMPAVVIGDAKGYDAVPRVERRKVTLATVQCQTPSGKFMIHSCTLEASVRGQFTTEHVRSKHGG